jgi:hypothetical protein
LNQNHFWELAMPRLIRLRLKVHNGLALALLLCLLAPWPALAEDIQAPPIGRVLKYTCLGDLGHELRFLVRSIENGNGPMARWRTVDWLGVATLVLIVLVLLLWALFGAEVFGLIR